MFENLFKNQKLLGLICIILLGSLILYPSIDFQPLLSQGDHGRDLYAFSITDQGDVVYQDYWWVYGPLMPYYYSIFENALGTNIPSILIGKSLLALLGSIFFYLILTTLISPALSIIGGLWFLLFKSSFFFTYNHAGGITLTLIIVYCSFLYLNNQKNKYLATGLFFVLLLSLVKVNFGATAFIFLLTSVIVTDRLNKIPLTREKKTLYVLGFGSLPLIIFGVYFFLVFRLPGYVIRQCLPYLSSDHPYNISVKKSLDIFLRTTYSHMTQNAMNLFFAILIWACTIALIVLLRKKQFSEKQYKKILLAIPLLMFFYVLNIHEYLPSGVFYRTFWAQPFSYLLIFIIIGLVTDRARLLIRILLYVTLIYILITAGVGKWNHLNQSKVPAQYLNLDRGKIYLGNSPEWIKTVTATTHFLEKNVADNESFFALPYDPIYYYLTGKKTPTRQTIFFDHINIPEQQERKIIRDLERNNVHWVVLSNRFYSDEHGLGTLGKTYCPIIGKYLTDNFEMAAQFGDWSRPAGWAWNHATRILKRK